MHEQKQYLKYLEDKIEAEAAFEKEVDRMYQEEVDKMWKKREKEWEEERNKRRQREQEVLREVQEQIKSNCTWDNFVFFFNDYNIITIAIKEVLHFI